MSTKELIISEESEMAECDGEKVVTMMDVLQEQQDFENDANAVLGASDEKNCTYPKGYIKRQALYACLTCYGEVKTDPKKRAGICLACSLICHDNHELIELYTKRNFRCDCGNPKFDNPCHFPPDKKELNTKNVYNQNFDGLYCVCSKQYPDPDAEYDDEMIQCIVCEDWLHAAHLEATVPANDQYAEMICKSCMQKNEFLHDYSELVVNVEDKEIEITFASPVSLSGEPATEVLVNDNSDINKDKLIDAEMNVSAQKPPEHLDVSVNENTNEDKANEIDSEHKNTGNDIADKVENSDNIDETDSVIQSTLESEVNLVENENSSNLNLEKQETKLSIENGQSESDQQKPKASPNSMIAEENFEKSEPSKVLTENEDTRKEIDKNNEANSGANDAVTNNIIEQSSLLGSENAEDQSKVSPIDKVQEAETVTDEKITHVLENDSTNSEKESETQQSLVEHFYQHVDVNMKSNEDIKEPTEDKLSENVSTDLNKGHESDTLEKESVELSKITVDKKENYDNSKTETKLEDLETINTKADTNDISNNAEINEYCTIQSTSSMDMNESKQDNKRKLDDSQGSESKKTRLEGCSRPKSKKVYKGATFWPAIFRQKLCTCSECLKMYEDLSVMFLIDLEDTVTAYEALGKERSNGSPVSQYEQGLEALSSLGRVQQINALTEYNKMRDKLLKFLKSFKDRRVVVKEEDIRAFFAGMRPRREPDGVYFCR